MIQINTTEPRIPIALQNVFLASNRGNEVLQPPPQNAASRTFFRFLGITSVDDSQLLASTQDSPQRKNQRLFSLGSPKKAMKQEADGVFSSPLKPKHPLGVRDTLAPPITRIKPNGSPKKPSRLPSMSPQDYLDGLMRNRGYSAERVNTVETAYHNTPTMLQRASYEKFLINLAKIGDLEALNDLISSGLSPNPANIYGESLCHMVCRQGHSSVLKLMIDLGCELQVCDDYGRTPLHDACWASKPAFEVVETLMAAGDTYHLFTMVDNRGSTPLSYIRKEHWAEWIQFLEAKKDVYWPARDKSEGMKEPPAITQERPHSRPLLDPEDALTLKLASMVASGAITPIEARQLMEEDNESTSGDDDSSYQDDTECSGSSYSDDEGDDSDCSLDEATMVNILQHMTAPDAKGKVIAWASNSTTSLDEMAQILEVLSNNGRKPIAWSQ